MPSIDLSGATARVELLNDDTCTITRNPGGLDDALLEQSTGILEDLDASVPVYSGACRVSESGAENQKDPGVEYSSGKYILGLPLTVMRAQPRSEPAVGDVVTIDSSLREPRLVGRVFEITSISARTFAVSRSCQMELRG